MNLRTTSRALVAGMAIVAALTMTACSSDDDNESSTSTTATTSAAATAAEDALPPVPTVDELNAQLQKALDPAVPSAEKANMIQGAEADPELPNTLAQEYAKLGATITVTGVQDLGTTLQANADIVVNGQTSALAVPFVAEDGVWKIENVWTCNLLKNAQIQSPACV